MPVFEPASGMDPNPEPHFPVLSSRQEAFCRHYVASGNAAGAARRAGYAFRSARQTGHALVQRPHVVERIRRIRFLWRETERAEMRIVLARLEQAWDAAVARGSAWAMLQVIRKQTELSGLADGGEAWRADRWSLPDEDEFGELAALDMGLDAPPEAGLPDGPLAGAVRMGRDRAERALARHRIAAKPFEGESGAGPDAETHWRLTAAIEERRRLGRRPETAGGRAAPCAAPEDVPEDVPETAPENLPEIGPEEALADDPPEDRYDRGGLPVPRTGPDHQAGDDAAVDTDESYWMQSLRFGERPADPWSEKELAIGEEIKARFAARGGPAEAPGDPEPGGLAPGDMAFGGLAPGESAEDDWFAAAQADIAAEEAAAGGGIPPLRDPADRSGRNDG